MEGGGCNAPLTVRSLTLPAWVKDPTSTLFTIIGILAPWVSNQPPGEKLRPPAEGKLSLCCWKSRRGEQPPQGYGALCWPQAGPPGADGPCGVPRGHTGEQRQCQALGSRPVLSCTLESGAWRLGNKTLHHATLRCHFFFFLIWTHVCNFEKAFEVGSLAF